MIFLDARPFLAEAVASVQRQSLASWELVLVDDGSTDGSREVAEAFAASDPERIRVVEHPGRRNRGTGASRNLGMEAATGRYLTFLDADDVYERNRLERTVGLLEADPDLGVVISRELYWRSWHTPRGLARLARMPDEVVGPSAPFGTVLPPPVLIASTMATPGAAMPGICSITFRRQSLVQLGGIPAQFDRQYEDQALIAKQLLHYPVMVIEDCLSRYRQHRDSLTHRLRETGEYRPGRPHPERERFISWLREYAAGIGVDEPVLQDALAGELRAHDGPDRLTLRTAKKKLQRAVLLAANALLPHAAVDRLIRWHLARQDALIGRLAAGNAAAVRARNADRLREGPGG